jgi:hypothetical protein
LADQSKVHRADAQFKKLQKAEDGKKAMSEYEAEQAAVRAKTERLKALRLARDAEAAAAAKAAPVKAAPAARKKAAGKAVKKTSASLSQWLSDQRESGRRS